MRTRNRARPLAWLIGILVTLSVACGDQFNTPIAPSTVGGPVAPPVGSRAGTPITWSLVEATPVGDCMADRLNADVNATVWPHFTVVLTRDDSSLKIHFNPDLEDDVGYLPGIYKGEVDGNGAVVASSVPWVGPFIDPYRVGLNPMCYAEYVLVEGRLTGTLGEDGKSISGIVEDTFRAIPSGNKFTVKTRFATK